MTQGNIQELLRSWVETDLAIMTTTDEQEVLILLEAEKRGRGRLKMMLRIYSRYSKLRSIREKQELGSLARG